MDLEILCVVDFSDQDALDLYNAAAQLGQTVDEVIRSAVKSFTAKCVPTQSNAEHAA